MFSEPFNAVYPVVYNCNVWIGLSFRNTQHKIINCLNTAHNGVGNADRIFLIKKSTKRLHFLTQVHCRSIEVVYNSRLFLIHNKNRYQKLKHGKRI